MFWWISDTEVVGPAVEGVAPGNFEVIEGPDATSREDVYYADRQVLLRPDRPSERHTWNPANHQWELPAILPVVVPQEKDWKGLEEDFRGSAIYAKVYTATIQPDANTIAALIKTQRAASAHTLLLSALTSTKSEADLLFAITELRGAMASITNVGDFTAEQVAFINERLELRGFDLRLE